MVIDTMITAHRLRPSAPWMERSALMTRKFDAHLPRQVPPAQAWLFQGVLALIPLLVISSALFAQAPPLSPDAIQSAWRQGEKKYDSRRNEILRNVAREASDGPFRSYWESLRSHQVPSWYEDAKFGIFIHWGLYSVPAFGNEWYSRNMYQAGSPEFKHQVATYGPQNKFGYKDFIPMFRAEHFDAHAWARLFSEAGAKYVVPVAEHHDGFPLYDSELTDWCARKMGPKRDLFGELATAVRAEGLHLGASSHRAEHDWFFDGGRQFDSDVNDPQFAAFYGPAQIRLVKPGYEDHVYEDWTYVSPEFLDDWLARTAEIVDKYHPDLIYFDWWINQPAFRDRLAEFASFYYNQAENRGGAVINYKYDAFEEHSATLDVERGQLSEIRPLHWQTDTSISNDSWGYIEGDTFKSPESIVRLLADVVSKNGNLLLNIGPRPDGTIPEPVQNVLREVGAWLKVNGEAIYGTRPWTRYGEGPTIVESGPFHEKDAKPYTAEDFRFTTKGQTLYAIELGWPRGGRATIHSLGSDTFKDAIEGVDLLGSDAVVEWHQTPDSLQIQVPNQPIGRYAYVFRILSQPKAGPAAN
jgi:alpha-L-fucosidase